MAASGSAGRNPIVSNPIARLLTGRREKQVEEKNETDGIKGAPKTADGSDSDATGPDSTHSQEAASPSEYQGIDELVKGTKRSLTVAQASDLDSEQTRWGEQARQIPRFASWISDSHLHSVNGISFTKINVEGCKEIFVPDCTVCFCNDPTTKRDFWVTATPKGRRAPKWEDWRRWHGVRSPNWRASSTSDQ